MIEKPTSRNRPYESVTWAIVFKDENEDEIDTWDFEHPPARIDVGDYIDFSMFAGKSGHVTKVSHYFSERLKNLRHVINIIIDTTASQE